MRNRLTLLLAAAALFCFTARSNAQFITFASELGDNVFTEVNGGGGYTIGGGGTGGVFSVYAGTDLTNLYAAALGMPLNQQVNVVGATVTLFPAVATGPVTTAGGFGDTFEQPLGFTSWEIRTSTEINGLPAGTILLAGTSDQSHILGAIGGTNHTLVGTDALGENVHFHSDIASVHAALDAYLQRTYSWVATGRNPANEVGAGGFLNSGTGSYVGNFAVSEVPEPGTLAMLLGSGIGSSLFVLRRRRK